MAYGKTDTNVAELHEAYRSVGQAAKAAGKAYMTFTATAEATQPLRDYGFTAFFVGSEHGWVMQGANAVAKAVHDAG